MKYIFALILCFSSAEAMERSKKFEGFQEGQSALSIFVGQPTFVRYDFWLNWKSALFFDAGYHFDKYFYGAVNYTFYFYNTRDFLRKERNFWNSLLFYAGPGFFAGFESEENADDSFKMGIRAFGGIEYLFDGQNYAIRAELGPAFFLQGDSFIGLQGAVGLTYYFGDHSKNKSMAKTVEDNVESAPRKVKRKKTKKSQSDNDESLEDEFEDF